MIGVRVDWFSWNARYSEIALIKEKPVMENKFDNLCCSRIDYLFAKSSC